MSARINPLAAHGREEKMNDDGSLRIDAASLIAFPAERPALGMHSREISTATDLCREVLRGEPLLSHVWKSAYGTVGTILIPVVDMTLFQDRRKTVEAALKGVRLAIEAGARCVSFTGMIPAATDFGRDIAESYTRDSVGDARVPSPSLTTGHAAVVAAFAFNVETILETAGRTYREESVAFVGIGSIGSGILRLLNDLAPPRKSHIVDVHEKKDRLLRLKEELGGEIEIVLIDKNEGLPSWIYDRCSLILSATSTPLVVDVGKMRPGTLMVDDSFPFGFDAERAASRIVSASDIMITLAGGLRGLQKFDLVYTAPAADRSADFRLLLDRTARIINPWPECMTGCVYSSLLTNHYDLPQTLGPVTYDDASAFHRRLREEGFCGTPPHIFTFGSKHSEAIYAMPSIRLDRPPVL
jgi:hypothetical protein